MFWSDIIIAHTVALAKATLYMKHKGKRKKETKQLCRHMKCLWLHKQYHHVNPDGLMSVRDLSLQCLHLFKADPLKISPNQLLDLKGKCIHDNAHTHKCTDLVLAHDEMHTKNALYITPTHTYSSHRCPWYPCIQTECKKNWYTGPFPVIKHHLS